MSEPMKPMEIEQRSFEIITELLGNRVLDPENELVIKRVIHTTADFSYRDTLTITDGAVEKAKEAIRRGLPIITDTTMAASGINKTAAGKFGIEVHCFIGDEDVKEAAKESGMTRSAVSAEKAAACSGRPSTASTAL